MNIVQKNPEPSFKNQNWRQVLKDFWTHMVLSQLISRIIMNFLSKCPTWDPKLRKYLLKVMDIFAFIKQLYSCWQLKNIRYKSKIKLLWNFHKIRTNIPCRWKSRFSWRHLVFSRSPYDIGPRLARDQLQCALLLLQWVQWYSAMALLW